MVKIRTFKGALANKDHVLDVISPAYDTLNTEEAREMVKGNDMSFLHVNKPEIDLPVGTDPYHSDVYLKGRDNLKMFIEKGYLVEDAEPTLYIYQQTMPTHSQRGIIGLASIQDYEAGTIKRHEFTLAKKEEDRTKLTDIQNANVGPVFLTFRENQESIKMMIDKVAEGTPYGDVTCDDGVRHVLWKCSQEQSSFLQAEFDKIPSLYIADGHHRTQAAYNVGKLRRERHLAEGNEYTGEEPFNFFMTLFYPADNLLIMDYNRVLKELPCPEEEFVAKLSEHFDISPLTTSDTKPAGIHKFTLLIGGKWHHMDLKAGSLDESTPTSKLDSQILNDLIFNPICGIVDLKKDSRIDFVGGIRGHKELERRCATDCKVAIAMNPCSLDELMDVADACLIMPPKSTWFEPKPRSGFVVRCFEGESVLMEKIMSGPQE